MEFASTNLRDRLLLELRQASAADIAVAYFCPDPEVLAALKDLPQLRLLVANDFQVNNPDSLECLNKHWVRAVSAELHGGNLHSKVYLVQRKDKSLWAMVGSANLTRPGLTTNQEACVIFDSAKGDTVSLKEIRKWLAELFDQEFTEIDFDRARGVFEAGKKWKSSKKTSAGKCWALKPGYCGEFWDYFLAESVVAIGWSQMPDTSEMTREQTTKVYRSLSPDESDGEVNARVAQIIRFTQTMQTDQLVLLCGRYDAVGTVDRDAYIYGVARTREVDGHCYFYDEHSEWWHFKRHATIQRIGQTLPRSMIAKALGIRSIVPTILELDHAGFARLEKLLLTELGLVLKV